MDRIDFIAAPLDITLHDSTALIVASRRWFREGLKGLLQATDISSALDAATLDAGLEMLGVGARPAVAIASLEGDDTQVLKDLETIQQWRSRLPHTKWVVLCSCLKPSILLASLRSGVHGLFHVDISEDVLRRAVELIMLGQVLFPAELAQLLLATAHTEADESLVAQPGRPECAPPQRLDRSPIDQVPLSPREQQILQCLVAGFPNKVIARELDIAEATVKVHIKGLLRKVKATNRTQAAIWAMNQRSAPTLHGTNIVKLASGGLGTLGLETRVASVSALARGGMSSPLGLATGD